jgi:hypothetical protein
VLVRNPEFRQWSAARPDGFPDRIVFRLDPDSDRQRNEQVDEVLREDADFMWAVAPAERLDELMTSYAGQLGRDGTPTSTNVGFAPKRHLARVSQGWAQSITQIVPSITRAAATNNSIAADQ